MSEIRIEGRLLYDTARAFHLAARHNQDLARCENDTCSRAREALGIKGYGHEYDDDFRRAVAEAEQSVSL